MSMPRRPAGDLSEDLLPGQSSAGHEAVDPVRVVATSLDALVRACRVSSQAAPTMAQRVLAGWQSAPELELRLEATCLRANEKEVLVAGEPNGRWILLAFMAGLRSIGLDHETSQADMLRLAGSLGRLEPAIETINAFRDWLWADGAEGFNVTLDFGFSEGLDAAVLDLDAHRKDLAALRMMASMSLAQDAQAITSREMDRAAARSEFGQLLEAYSQVVRHARLELSTEEAGALREAWDDTSFWLEGQINLVLDHPDIQCGQSVETISRHALTMLSRTSLANAMQFVAKMKSYTSGPAKSLYDSIMNNGAGSVIAQKVVSEPHSMPLVANVLVQPSDRLSKDLATGLVNESINSTGSFNAMGRFLQTFGVDPFMAFVDLSAVRPQAAVGLCRLIVALQGPGSVQRDLVTKLAPDSLHRLAVVMGPEFRRKFAEQILKATIQIPFRDAIEFVDLLFTDRSFDWSSQFGALLAETRGEGIAPPLLRSMCSHISNIPGACRWLVPLIRQQGVTIELRRAAARGIVADEAAVEEVLKRRVSDLVLSQDVREILNELRDKVRS